MNVSDKQIESINEFRLMDQYITDRLEAKQFVKNARIAIDQVLVKEHPHREDFYQLENSFPGITALIAQLIGNTTEEFMQQLDKCIVLNPKVKQALESIQAEWANF